ncbi:hypothetical protein KCU89_g17171, partial [Aureobasidium melanogenum]
MMEQAEASSVAAVEQKQSQPKGQVQLPYQKPLIDVRLDPSTPITPSQLSPPARPSVLRLSVLDSYYLDNMV